MKDPRGIKMVSIPVKDVPDTNGLILDSINRNKNGDYYIIFRVPKVPRGMHGKTKGHVDEVLIIGVPQARLDEFLRNHYRDKEVLK